MKPRKISRPGKSTENDSCGVNAKPVIARRLSAFLITLAAVILLLSGCGGFYLIKQGIGQLDISINRVSLSDPGLLDSLTPLQREKVAWIPRILQFAEKELGLEPGDSYTSYYDTGGKPVSHTVVACHQLALVPYQWCFPLVGCVPYKGHFDPADAHQEVHDLKKAGWDAEVFPVSAYSTLGWFSDPVLSSMLELPLPELVDLLLHELTHRTLYIPSRSQLNEGFATHMGREGTRLFFTSHPAAVSGELLAEYHESIQQEARYSDLISRLKNDLDTLYRSDAAREQKLARKKELFASATIAARELFANDSITLSSNARIVASETYKAELARMERLQKQVGGHPRDLLKALRSASDKGAGELEKLLEKNP